MPQKLYLLEKEKEELTGYVVKIQISDYKDLFFTMSDLLKVSMIALESEDDSTSRFIVDSRSNIKTLLEIVHQLIPFQEAAFLDDFLLQRDENNENL